MVYSVSWWNLHLIYIMSRWNCNLFVFSGYLSIHSDWSTVCLGEIVVSLSPLATFLSIQTDLQCVSVKLPSLYLHWLPFYPFRLIYSVSRWNQHLSITTGPFTMHSDWSTVYLGEIASAISIGYLPFHSFRLIYSVSRWYYRLSISTGYLSVHSDWSTVCLGETAISLSPLVTFLSIQTDL